MKNIAYLALDVHARNSVLGHMDHNGNFKGNRHFTTSQSNIVEALKSVKANNKYLIIEESTLARWTAQVAASYVNRVIVCDPKENALIYKSPKKNDKVDTRNLCRLLRLGEFKSVYQPQNDERAIFKAAVQHYLDLRDQLSALKNKIKATYRRWGVIDVFTDSVYSRSGREKYLQRIPHLPIRDQLQRLYELVDHNAAAKDSAKKAMKQLARNYAEIKEFKKMPGIADVRAHIFAAFIQTPHRFATKSRLYRYCKLAVTDKSSDGKPLGNQKLDRGGVGELKALSYRAFMAAMKSDNEVRRFYLQSLKRTQNRKHARLNTQRKILSVLLGIWKKGKPYRAELFSASA